MTTAAKLQRLRYLCGFTQEEVARLSGVGSKTISSFETGDRAHAMRVVQLEAILSVYNVTLAQFFTPNAIEMLRAPWEIAA